MNRIAKLLLAALLTTAAFMTAPPEAAAAGPCDRCDRTGDCYACCRCDGGGVIDCSNACGL
jgi:hypothetical protein